MNNQTSDRSELYRYRLVRAEHFRGWLAARRQRSSRAGDFDLPGSNTRPIFADAHNQSLSRTRALTRRAREPSVCGQKSYRNTRTMRSVGAERSSTRARRSKRGRWQRRVDRPGRDQCAAHAADAVTGAPNLTESCPRFVRSGCALAMGSHQPARVKHRTDWRPKPAPVGSLGFARATNYLGRRHDYCTDVVIKILCENI